MYPRCLKGATQWVPGILMGFAQTHLGLDILSLTLIKVMGLAPDPFGSRAVSTRDIGGAALQDSGSAKLLFLLGEKYEKTLNDRLGYTKVLID